MNCADSIDSLNQMDYFNYVKLLSWKNLFEENGRYINIKYKKM